MALTPVKGNIAPPSLNSLLQANPGDRVSADKSEIGPVVAILSRQLPLPQAQQFAGQTLNAQVLKSAPNGNAELDVDGQAIPVKLPPGRTLSPGEMIAVTFALQDKDGPLSAQGSAGTKKTSEVNNLLQTLGQDGDGGEQSASFVDKLSSSARLIGLLDRLNEGQNLTQPTTTRSMAQLLQADGGKSPLAGLLLEAPQSDLDATPSSATSSTSNASVQAKEAPGRNQASQATASVLIKPFEGLSGQLAKEVSNAVQHSGLFYESHLQQWANGERSKEQLSLEPQARFGPEQQISEKGISSDALQQSVKLVSAQLAALDHSRVNLSLQGLMDQPVNVQIERDEAQADDPSSTEGEPPRPWVAKLKLDMAHLGELHVRLRLVGNRCDILMSGSPESKAAIDPHWSDAQAAFEQKGLSLAHGQIRTQGEDLAS